MPSARSSKSTPEEEIMVMAGCIAFMLNPFVCFFGVPSFEGDVGHVFHCLSIVYI